MAKTAVPYVVCAGVILFYSGVVFALAAVGLTLFGLVTEHRDRMQYLGPIALAVIPVGFITLFLLVSMIL